jgi:hypothetical protein
MRRVRQVTEPGDVDRHRDYVAYKESAMLSRRSTRNLITLPLSVAALAVSASSLLAQGDRSSIGVAVWTAKFASRCTAVMRAP